MTELEKLLSEHETTKREVELLKNKVRSSIFFVIKENKTFFQLRSLPEELIIETPEFKCLQSRYTALVNETVHLRHQLSEARELVKCTKTHYDQQFEKIEVISSHFFASNSFSFSFSARRVRKSTQITRKYRTSGGEFS